MSNDGQDTIVEARLAVAKLGERVSSLQVTTSREIKELRGHMDGEFEEIRQKMGTMNAHLDNIAREASIANAHHDRTNELLEEDLRERRGEKKRQLDLEEARLKLEAEELTSTWQQKEADREDKRELQEKLFTAAGEAWSVFKQPLAYLAVAIVGYIAWYYLGAKPPFQIPPQQLPEMQVEADE